MSRRLKQLMRLPRFLVWFVGQMFHANWQVAVDILTPGSALTPAIVAYRPRSVSAREITALNNLVTLTPGTLAIDIDDVPGRGHTLYVLGLYASEDPEVFRAELRELEDRLLRVTRPEQGRGKEANH